MTDTGTANMRHAMVLAAGRGERMRPLTETRPKPLVEVMGRPLIDHVLDRLADAGVARTVVNVHYLADQLETHLEGHARPAVAISDERAALLDSGGGIAKALRSPETAWLGEAPFLLLNADTIWIEGIKPNVPRLAASFDPARMDVLLLLAPAAISVGYDGRGDYGMDPEGRLERRAERDVAPFVYAGAAVLNPAIFAKAPEGPFSLVQLFDEAQEAGRLFGLRLEGLWMHVGTPEAVDEAERAIRRSTD